jgi:hypothetical protein
VVNLLDVDVQRHLTAANSDVRACDNAERHVARCWVAAMFLMLE